MSFVGAGYVVVYVCESEDGSSTERVKGLQGTSPLDHVEVDAGLRGVVYPPRGDPKLFRGDSEASLRLISMHRDYRPPTILATLTHFNVHARSTGFVVARCLVGLSWLERLTVRFSSVGCYGGTRVLVRKWALWRHAGFRAAGRGPPKDFGASRQNHTKEFLADRDARIGESKLFYLVLPSPLRLHLTRQQRMSQASQVSLWLQTMRLALCSGAPPLAAMMHSLQLSKCKALTIPQVHETATA
ncbi:hypothetical protein BKA93DRAFT_750729 [Sparassis latifolia]